MFSLIKNVKVITHAKTIESGKEIVRIKKPLYIRYKSCKFADWGNLETFCKKSIPIKKISKDIKIIKKYFRYFNKRYFVISFNNLPFYNFRVNLDFTSLSGLFCNASIAFRVCGIISFNLFNSSLEKSLNT